MILKPRLFRKPRIGHPLSKGLVGLWLFNEGSGGQVFDLSGNGHEATLVGDAAWVAGKFGQCLDLPGTTDYIDIVGSADGGSNPINLDDSFTLLIWVYFHTAQSCYIIGNYSDSQNHTHINLHTDPSGADMQIKAHIDDNINPTSLNGGTVAINTWNHLALVRDKGSTVSLHINGLYDSGTPDITTGTVLSNQNWRIGCKSNNPTEEEVDGLVDLPMIYNRVLSTSELALLHREPFCMFERDPIELWSAATLGAAPPAGMAGAMTTNTGYWGW